MAVSRPLKEGSVRTYQEKVALGFPDILASEMDADLDTIYAAWNGGMPNDSIGALQIIDGSVGTPELANGAVTTPKLAAAPNGVATGNVNDAAITTAKIALNAVTWPNLALQSYARVGRSLSAQSIPNATFTTLIFDSIGVNVGGLYSAATPDRVTIQQAGFYVFGGGGQFATSGVGQNRMMQLAAGANLGQTSVRPSTTIPTDLTAASGNYLGVGNTVQLIVYQDSGGALQISTTSIWICRVS